MRFFITTALTACILSVQAHASIIPINDYEQALPPGAQATVLVQSTASNQPMLAYQPDKMVLPASTQKVFTALAALLELGPDFRFNTTVGTSAAIQEGAVNGDLVVKFTGDPRLTRDQVRNLALQLSKQNIRSVSGNLVIDTSVFGSHDKAPGWSWNDLTQCFNALPAAASIDGNCFYAVLNSAPT
ncbi:MAG: D-alanyl-D-alanine carboxypeptidase/D-alanyl-D-alanine endopeptidase, partial [Plesiomonas sp.]